LVQNQQILQQAINESLLSLGEPIMKTIKWHLGAHGLFIDSKDQVDVRVLYSHLEQIVGNIADVVMDEIYVNLSQRNTVTVGSMKSSESALTKIEQLLKVEEKEREEAK
jgi:hypothetical protein